MEQLIQILSERPLIIPVLLSWPIFLWIATLVAQKILYKFDEKN